MPGDKPGIEMPPAAPWRDLAAQGRELYGKFRESRLCTQVVLSLGIVGIAWAVTVLPGPQAAQVREQLTWAATHDYDFAGQWQRANQWAGDRGGWYRALAAEWQSGVERVQTWAHSVLPPGDGGSADSGAPAGGGTAGGGTADGGTPGTGPAGTGTTGGGTAADPGFHTIMPVNGHVLYGYGWLAQGGRPHQGLDLAAAVGAPVAAISDGTVSRIGTDPVLGGFVEVDHGFGVALYGQVGGVKVKVGDKVKLGQTLAVVAKPTAKEGDGAPHLHVELRTTRGGSPIDPAPFLPLGAGAEGGSAI